MAVAPHQTASSRRSASGRAWHWQSGQTTLILRFRVTPGATRDDLRGLIETPQGPAIVARVRAVPENGAANRALIQLAAKRFGVAKSAIELTAGARSRIKTLQIGNLTTADIAHLTPILETIGKQEGSG